jgi:hypothetical protein
MIRTQTYRRKSRRPTKPLMVLEIFKIVAAAPFGLLLGWIVVELAMGNSPSAIAHKAEQAVATIESLLR